MNAISKPLTALDTAAKGSIDISGLRPVACDSLVRMGSANDGGYVVPLSAVKAANVLLSFGLSHNWTFERDFKRLNPAVLIHCYDHTVSFQTTIEYSVRQLLISILRFSGTALRRAAAWLDYPIFFRGNVIHFKTRVWPDRQQESATIDDIFGRLPPESRVFVKMDIEGSEYRVLDDLLRHADTIEAIAIEFHDIDMLVQRFNELTEKIKEKFHIVHIHANNHMGVTPCNFPIALEVSFLNRRNFASIPERSLLEYPVPGLDQPNNPRSPDIKLNFDAR